MENTRRVMENTRRTMEHTFPTGFGTMCRNVLPVYQLDIIENHWLALNDEEKAKVEDNLKKWEEARFDEKFRPSGSGNSLLMRHRE